MKKTVYTLLSAALLLPMAGCSSKPADSSTSSAAGSSAVSDASAITSEGTSSAKEEPAEPAIYAVGDILANTPFSRQSVINQLIDMGYSKSTAESAVDEYGADWVENAKEMLNRLDKKDHDEAIQTLLDFGFTQEEAEAAVE